MPFYNPAAAVPLPQVDDWRERCRRMLVKRTSLQKLDKCLDLLVLSVAAALEALRQMYSQERLQMPQQVAAAVAASRSASMLVQGQQQQQPPGSSEKRPGSSGGRTSSGEGPQQSQRGGFSSRIQQRQQQQPQQQEGSQTRKRKALEVDEGRTEAPRTRPRREGEGSQQQLYCICLQPHENDTYISCDTCNDWYHLKCVGLNNSQVKTMKRWVCPVCCAVRGDGEGLAASAERLHRTRHPTLEDVEALLEDARALPIQLPEEAVLTMVLQQYKIWQVGGARLSVVAAGFSCSSMCYVFLLTYDNAFYLVGVVYVIAEGG